MAQRDIVLTIPISTKVERSCHTWPRNIFIKLATFRSISPRSFANLLIIRPVGLVWKKTIGALNIECNMVSCSLLAACRLDMINQKEFPSVTVTWIEHWSQPNLMIITFLLMFYSVGFSFYLFFGQKPKKTPENRKGNCLPVFLWVSYHKILLPVNRKILYPSHRDFL